MQQHFHFRRLPALLLAAVACACTAAAVAAPAWPDKPITLVLGFPPGGALDTIARTLADEMGKTLKQKVIIDNRPGAGGNIATSAVLGAPADGYTLLMAGINLATAPALGPVRYDPRTALTMVTQVTSVPVLMLAAGKGGFASAADAIASARKAPQGLKIGTGGIGTSGHLAAELLSRSQHVAYLHVPYRGGAPANMALISGEVDLIFDLGSGSLKSFIDAGSIKPLAVMQATRVASLPDVKTAREAGLPAATEIRSWQGIAVKAGTPAAIVDTLHKAALAAVDTPALRARTWQLGSETATSKTPAALQQFYLAELDRWAAVIKDAGIKAQ